MERPTLYLCDPEKNTDCRKSSCVHNPDAIHKACFATANPELAVLDRAGMPVRLESKTWMELTQLTEEVEKLSAVIVQTHEQSANDSTKKRIKKLESTVSFLFGLCIGQFLYLLFKQIFFV